MRILAALIVLALGACTLEVGHPTVEVRCVIVELPGGTVETSCPDGGVEE